MKKYWRIAQATWQEYFQYRMNFFLEILGGILTAVVILFLWLKVYESSGSVQIGGYSLAEMITYIIGGGIIHFVLFYIFSIISFWLGRTWGFRFVMRVIMEVATGAIIPLSLLPGVWRTIIEAMPFKYLVYFPMQIYLGKISTAGIIQSFTYEMIWLVGLIFVAWVIWRNGVKHYTAALLILATFTFWTIQATGMGRFFENIIRMARYPTDIYSGAVRILLVYIIPISLIAVVPSKALLGTLSWQFLIYAVLFSIILFIIANRFWHFGLKHYQSASS